MRTDDSLESPWCSGSMLFEGKGEENQRWDGWMAPPIQWTWTWATPGNGNDKEAQASLEFDFIGRLNKQQMEDFSILETVIWEISYP